MEGDHERELQSRQQQRIEVHGRFVMHRRRARYSYSARA
jgi:hypothetical protein